VGRPEGFPSVNPKKCDEQIVRMPSTAEFVRIVGNFVGCSANYIMRSWNFIQPTLTMIAVSLDVFSEAHFT
jgi:hypothetical protein